MRCFMPCILAVVLLPTASALAQPELFVFHGEERGADFGFSVADGGDVDGDGVRDLVVGAPGIDYDSLTGRAYVLSGRTGALLHRFEGEDWHTWFGRSVAGAGDLDGDGFADILVGSPSSQYTDAPPGFVRAYSGRTGAVLFAFSGASVSEFFGWSVNGPGDVNQDGWPDLLIGVPGDDTSGPDAGAVLMVSGRDGGIIERFYGQSDFEQLGRAVSGAGDVDLDGYQDIVAGARMSTHEGRLRVYSGRDGAILRDIPALEPYGELGWAVHQAGDVNADGFADVIAGSPFTVLGSRLSVGRADVFSGRDGTVLQTFKGKLPFEEVGLSVDMIGDLDGDGQTDLIVGASSAARIYSGSSGQLIYELPGNWYEGFGVSVAGLHDLNGDGLPEVIVGAPSDDSGGEITGSAFVFGGTTCPSTWAKYGVGWRGSQQTPRLELTSNPRLCHTIDLTVSNSLGVTTTAVLFGGLSDAYLPTAWDGHLLVLPEHVYPFSLSSAGAVLPFSIPCDGMLCQVATYFQVLELDAGASKGVSFTRGLLLVLGE
jgi:hypothetical protein